VSLIKGKDNLTRGSERMRRILHRLNKTSNFVVIKGERLFTSLLIVGRLQSVKSQVLIKVSSS
jgi:hypothetical protein